MNLIDMIQSRVHAKLSLIAQAGAKPIQTPSRWATLNLLPDIKKELPEQQGEVDIAYEQFKKSLPKGGISHIVLGHDDIFCMNTQE